MVQNGTELVQNGKECLKGTEWYRIKVSKRHIMVIKNAATPFFNNSGTVGPRKFKFGTQVGNPIVTIVLQL